MFKTITLKDILQLVALITISIVVSYLYANSQARNQLWQKTYPLRAEISLLNLKCTEDAPSWMSDIIKYQAKTNYSPSNQLAYIDDKGVQHFCSNGYKEKYPLISKAVDTHTRFRYASVTKLWTSDSILELSKEGKLKLTDSISRYLPQIHNPKDSRVNDITVRDLLLHRGGFDRTSVLGHDMFNIGKPICPNQIHELNNIELNFTPDTKTSYSNLGFCLLGEIIANIEGVPYRTYITQKYNLDDTSLAFIDNERLDDEVFYNHTESGLTGIADIYTAFDYPSLSSSAGLSGNAADLANQVSNMANKAEPNIMTQDSQLSCDISTFEACYGYAMFAYRQPNTQKIYFRDGALLGLSSLVAITEDKQVVVLLSNGRSKGNEDATKKNLAKYLSPTNP